MDAHTAVKVAVAYLEGNGFEVVGVSGQGDAYYLARPGHSERLRVGSYAHRHMDDVTVLTVAIVGDGPTQ